MKSLTKPARPSRQWPSHHIQKMLNFQHRMRPIASESSSKIDASTEGTCSALTNVGLSGLDRHKMKKKSHQKATKIPKRLAAHAAAVEQPKSTDGAVGNDGTRGYS